MRNTWRKGAHVLWAGSIAALVACGGGGGGSPSTNTNTNTNNGGSANTNNGGAGGSAVTPTSGTLALFVGDVGGAGNTDGSGSAARFSAPTAGAVDGAGNLYILDNRNQAIRKVTANGQVSTVLRYSAASLTFPSGLCVDPAGNLFIANQHVIEKVTSSGVASVYAGGQPGSDDGIGTAAQFNFPGGVACDAAGNVYVADTQNSTVRKIAPGAVVSTLAGTAPVLGSADGTGAAARFMNPRGVAVDANGNVWVSDSFNHTLRKITAAGVVTTFAGAAGSAGSTNGNGSVARFYTPSAIAIDVAGNLYVEDRMNAQVRKITPDANVTTVAGTTGGGIGLTFGLAGAGADVAYIIGSDDDVIRKIDGSTVSVFAGTPTRRGWLDATGSAALFFGPTGLAAEANGTLHVVDSLNSMVRRVGSTGQVRTTAGNAVLGGSADGVGSAARFLNPRGAAVDSAGNVYVADMSNHTVRKIASDGTVTTFVGTAGVSGSADGTGTAALLNLPQGLVFDTAGNLYVADGGNHVIRKITPTGVTSTLAGSAAQAGSTDGTGSAARFGTPANVAIDAAGNLYVTDDSYSQVRRITPAGVVTTFAGIASPAGSADGSGTAARFFGPKGLAVDGGGNVFVADTGNHTIRRITPAGQVTTVAGVAGEASFLPGALPGRLSSPVGLALSGQRLYVSMRNGVVAIDMTP